MFHRDSSIAKKDLNALESNFKLQLSKEISEKFFEQLIKDTEFMSQNNIIDYSMLFGIHKKNLKGKSQRLSNGTGTSYLLSSYASMIPKQTEEVFFF